MSNSKYQDIDGYLLFYTLNVIKDLSYFMEDLDGLGSEILQDSLGTWGMNGRERLQFHGSYWATNFNIHS